MMRLSAADIARFTGGTLYDKGCDASAPVCGVTLDSRAVEAGSLFVALPGERVDGNDFIVKAIVAGAGAVMCTREPDEGMLAMAGEFTCPIIVVDDGQEALGRLAACWRSRLRAMVIGVTGSTGKTSTKDLLASVLSQRYRVHATQGNHNNELGVPLTILGAAEDCDILIVEMGMRGLGQIEALCAIAQPTIGVVTNVGVSHLELLGTRDNIARAKGELIAALPTTGLAVVNADDEMTEALLSSAHADEKFLFVYRFGTSENAYTAVDALEFDEEARAHFDLSLGGKEPFHVDLGMPGRHNVTNALAVACVADYLGLSPQLISAGFAAASGSAMRLEMGEAACGARIINDAYNANPDSMAAALDTLAAIPCDGRRIAVLGDMGELGSDETALHRRVGAKAAEVGVDVLVCIGRLSAHIAAAATEAGMSAESVRCFDAAPEAALYLREALASSDVVLVKASRFMGLERIVEELCA